MLAARDAEPGGEPSDELLIHIDIPVRKRPRDNLMRRHTTTSAMPSIVAVSPEPMAAPSIKPPPLTPTLRRPLARCVEAEATSSKGGCVAEGSNDEGARAARRPPGSPREKSWFMKTYAMSRGVWYGRGVMERGMRRVKGGVQGGAHGGVIDKKHRVDVQGRMRCSLHTNAAQPPPPPPHNGESWFESEGG